MKIEVLDIVEHPEGGANLTVELDAESQRALIEIGINEVLKRCLPLEKES